MGTLLLWLVSAGMALAASHPAAVEGDFILRDFRFQTGETLPELNIHYRTIGKPAHEAVLILHGTGGSGEGFVTREQFAGELFGPGQPLDGERYFLILPDGIGHGKSSKPSDGLRERFPKYGYRDMVEAQRRLLREKFGVQRLRLIVGTSMGCMHAWVWGTEHPDEVDAMLPLACLPHQISGRNLLWRRMITDTIRTEPAQGVALANNLSILMAQNTLALQKQAPTRAEAVALFEKQKAAQRPRDPDDTYYQFEASWDYDPGPKLDKVTAAAYAVNFADDPINPPELGIFEREVRRVKRAKAVVVPASEETRGHGTHSLPVFWKQYLVEVLRMSDRK